MKSCLQSREDIISCIDRMAEGSFAAIDFEDILAYRKRDFQIDVLVFNGYGKFCNGLETYSGCL